jgi:hypothetical protein
LLNTNEPTSVTLGRDQREPARLNDSSRVESLASSHIVHSLIQQVQRALIARALAIGSIYPLHGVNVLGPTRRMPRQCRPHYINTIPNGPLPLSRQRTTGDSGIKSILVCLFDQPLECIGLGDAITLNNLCQVKNLGYREISINSDSRCDAWSIGNTRDRPLVAA